MFSNLSGWHAIIIGVFVIVVVAAVIVGVVLIGRRPRDAVAAPGYAGTGGPVPSAPDASTRLSQLTDLRDRGQITDAEYEASRRQILDGL